MWALNPDKSKLAPELIGPYTFISVNKDITHAVYKTSVGYKEVSTCTLFALPKLELIKPNPNSTYQVAHL